MVDAASPPESMHGRATDRVTAEAVGDRPLEVTVHVGKGDAAEIYSALCRHMLFAPPQNPAWVSAWAADAPTDIVVVELSSGERPTLVLALEIAKEGPFRVARFVGGRHANGNFPATNPALSARPALKPLLRALRQIRPDIDMLALERQASELEGHTNPLLALRHCQSPNIALAADLSGGFEALLARVNGKRKRKKHRAQARKFEAAGGFRHLQARTAEETEQFLSAFFAMKAEQFAKAGVSDSFADEQTRAAFTRLFAKARRHDHRPVFILQALEVGGKLRAVSGSSRAGDRIVCEFTAFADDELAPAGPGDFLFFENIRAACEEGCAIYDFSVGDERYKREWCDIETRQFDVFLPLKAKGRLLAEARYAISNTKRRLKSSPAARRVLRRLRSAKSGN